MERVDDAGEKADGQRGQERNHGGNKERNHDTERERSQNEIPTAMDECRAFDREGDFL